VIEDIAKERAKRIVIELLKGNREFAEFFYLAAREQLWGADAGKPFVYDPDAVRSTIVNAFKAEIASAEMIALQEENKRLEDELKWRREN
jgi:hypothetical protein